jgi:phage/plasmid-like protein (TIGR03299 family)
MSHELAVTDGVAHMTYNSQRGIPWHRLGIPIEGFMDFSTAWENIKGPRLAKIPMFGDYFGQSIQSNDCMVIRLDTNHNLGTVGQDYDLLQYNDPLISGVLDSLVGQGNRIDCMGMLYNGSQFFVTVELPEQDEVVPGDKNTNYLIYWTSCNGSKAHNWFLTKVRAVCKNTLSAGLSSASSNVRVKHTVNATDRLKMANKIISDSANVSKSLTEKLRILAQKKMTRESMEMIMEKLFPKPKEKEDSTRRKNLIEEILILYANNDNNAIPQIRGTGYNLLNAVTEWTDYQRTTRMTDAKKGMSVQASRSQEALFGTGQALKEKALEIIMQGTKDSPSVPTVQYFNSPSLLDQVLESTPA